MSARRTGLRAAAGLLFVTLVVAAVALAAGAATPGSGAPGAVTPGAARATRPAATDPDLVARGRELYLTSCVSCHGVAGAGTDKGPPLLESGEAAADFYLRTGRMPLAVTGQQPPQKPVAYDDAQIRALVAYVGSIGTGPAIPVVDPARGELNVGSELFLSNCAACHNSAGIGGALSHGNYAPSLQNVATEQIAEAMRVGPGQMPRFGPDVFDEHQLNSIVRYVKYLHAPDDPGGLNLGYTGPVPEGFVAFLFGIGGLIIAARWITREKDQEPIVHDTSTHEPTTDEPRTFEPRTDEPRTDEPRTDEQETADRG